MEKQLCSTSKLFRFWTFSAEDDVWRLHCMLKKLKGSVKLFLRWTRYFGCNSNQLIRNDFYFFKLSKYCTVQNVHRLTESQIFTENIICGRPSKFMQNHQIYGGFQFEFVLFQSNWTKK
jgi:hypothetical protein